MADLLPHRPPADWRAGLSDHAPDADALRADLEQGYLFADLAADKTRRKETLEQELAYRNQHLEALREYLSGERERILQRLIPARHEASGDIQILPVALEIRLPAR